MNKDLVKLFGDSWDRLEGLYQDLDGRGWQMAKHALLLLKEMRVREFDKVLHAGSSMSTMVFSRASKYHDIQGGSVSISLHYIGVQKDEPSMKLNYDIRNDEESIVGECVYTNFEYNASIEYWLSQLQKEDVR